jgi:hypothetical protein
MRKIILARVLTACTAAPLLAQSERGYLDGSGGFAISPEGTSGDVLFEGGVRVAPHPLVFGDLGWFHNLQPSAVQPSVDSATAAALASQGLGVTGIGRVPATYSLGGLRFESSIGRHLSSYILGGVGMARLTPSARFTLASGTLPDGTTPSPGQDVTRRLSRPATFPHRRRATHS